MGKVPDSFRTEDKIHLEPDEKRTGVFSWSQRTRPNSNYAWRDWRSSGYLFIKTSQVIRGCIITVFTVKSNWRAVPSGESLEFTRQDCEIHMFNLYIRRESILYFQIKVIF